MQGIIERIQRDSETGVIRGDDGREFSFQQGSLGGLPFEALKLGTKVEFGVAGEAEAINVQVAGEMKAEAADRLSPSEQENPDVGAVSSQVPPAAVASDEVNEPSWESFPTSDAPARHQTT